jgi:DNA primase large subunit
MASVADLEGQSLIEIAEYHNDAVDALSFFLNSLFQQSDSRFLGYSLSEFNDFLLTRIEETELRSSLAILAALEAAVRIDYQLRVKQRQKDALSREFRAVYKKKQERARFDEDLLELWARHNPSFKVLIGELRAALHFRHWLAHGRYWMRPTHRRFDYLSLYQLAELIFGQLPLYRN